MIQYKEAVSEIHHAPVIIQNSGRLTSPAWPGPSSIVLQTAVKIVKRLAIVGAHLIELPDRNIVDVLPMLAAIVRHCDAAILTLPHPIRIFRVDPKRVIVDVSLG